MRMMCVMTLAAVPSLPRPPAAAHYLFEAPGLGVVALLAIGISVLVVFNRRAQIGRGVAIGGACVLAAAAWWMTARLVTTTREVLIARSGALVEAAGRIDTDALGPLIGDQVRVIPWRDSIGRDDLLDDLESVVRGRGGVESARVVTSSATVDGPNVGRTLVRVRVELSAPAPPLSWWRIDWVRSDGQWRAVRLEWLDAPDWIRRSGFD